MLGSGLGTRCGLRKSGPGPMPNAYKELLLLSDSPKPLAEEMDFGTHCKHPLPNEDLLPFDSKASGVSVLVLVLNPKT